MPCKFVTPSLAIVGSTMVIATLFKHGCIGARCLRHGIDKERDRRGRPRIAARLQLAHVAANAAKPEQILAPLSLPAKFRFPETENVIGRDRFEFAVYGQKAKPVGPPG